MAGVKAMAVTGEVATGTSKKTILQLIAASNHRVLIKEWSISFDGISNTAAPIIVSVERQSDAGTGGSSVTMEKLDNDAGETLQTTANYGLTAEPTNCYKQDSHQVHPQGGYTWQAPFGGELVVNGGDRIGIAVTAAAGVNAIAKFIFEE